MGKLKDFRDKRKRKKYEKENKWLNSLGLDDMSDDEFLSKKNMLLKDAILRVVVGVLMFIALIVVLACLWDTIFWTEGWWF